MALTISAIGSTAGVSAKFSDISPHEMGVMSLDDRLRDAFSTNSVSTQNEYNFIMNKVNDQNFDVSPKALLELQVRLGEYKQGVEIISALTRKGVATIESLLKT
ncbi:type III secretion system inner rod subunit SctI [Glaciimonas sp. PAMC28666]|uniref:type III secretion system inner rod subunit SctI n=1 Tax=Glaciimonas sp. PAMC28666 TaxID=2807626 RepID=UPI0019637B0A|nr:type III secretion system inner rod subunit SctI [Glaciimonas sp. PAMC28666]QRX82153.1 type III secretion system inner rod subunit SctI [Glaciimonas sp. PAMC28666]